MKALWIQKAITNMTGLIILLIEMAAVVILAALIILIIFAVIKTIVQSIFKGGKKDE